MSGHAIQRLVRQSPRKMRLVIDLIRGKDVNEAYAILKYNKKLAAKQIAKTLKSAVANAEQKALKALKSYSVIYDDMRFPNEFEMVKRNGGFCVRISRPGEGSRGDTSIGEGLLDSHNFDAYITNDGTLEDLKRFVWQAADYLESK